jgi:hypothetical protein
MAFLGNVREGLDKAKFRMRASRSVVPVTVFMLVFLPGDPPLTLPTSPDSDTDMIANNEFKNTVDLDLTNKALGLASIRYGATDGNGKQSVRVDTFRVASSYGRNYGEAYGEGL